MDKKERKRYQNRLAQRTYRRNQKLRIQALEAALWSNPLLGAPPINNTTHLPLIPSHYPKVDNSYGTCPVSGGPALEGLGVVPLLNPEYFVTDSDADSRSNDTIATTSTTAHATKTVDANGIISRSNTRMEAMAPQQRTTATECISHSHCSCPSIDTSSSSSSFSSLCGNTATTARVPPTPPSDDDALIFMDPEPDNWNYAENKMTDSNTSSGDGCFDNRAPPSPSLPLPLPSAPANLPERHSNNNSVNPNNNNSKPSGLSCTALHRAIHTGNLPITRLLINGGASVTRLDSNGCTPLYLTASITPPSNKTDNTSAATTATSENVGAEMVDLLLQNHADPNTPNHHDGQTPLFAAAKNNRVDIAKRLIAAGANVNARDINGAVPMHFAVENDAVGMVELLLEHGADANS